jgi:hypothetical protein
MKAEKYKNEHYANQLTKFIEGQDSDDHYSLQGDLEIASIMYVNLNINESFSKFYLKFRLFN